MRKVLIATLLVASLSTSLTGCAAFGIYPTATSDDFAKISDEALFLQLTDAYAVGSGNPCTTLAELIAAAPSDANSAELLYAKYSTLVSTFKSTNPDLSNYMGVLAGFADRARTEKLNEQDQTQREALETRLSSYCTSTPSK